MLDGSRVTTAKQWNEKRRPQLKGMFEQYMYGEIPPKPKKLNFKSNGVDKKFLNGKATLKLVTISIPGSEAPRIDLLLITPNAVQKAPVFLAMNFCGNHAVHPGSAVPGGTSSVISYRIAQLIVHPELYGRLTRRARRTRRNSSPLIFSPRSSASSA